jgi:hypothetical protein
MDFKEFRSLAEDFRYSHASTGDKFKELEEAWVELDNEKDELERQLCGANQEIESLKARLFDLGESANV